MTLINVGETPLTSEPTKDYKLVLFVIRVRDQPAELFNRSQLEKRCV